MVSALPSDSETETKSEPQAVEFPPKATVPSGPDQENNALTEPTVELREALNGVGEVSMPVVLASVLFFINCELMLGLNTWKTHLEGARVIMSKLRTTRPQSRDRLEDSVVTDCMM